MFALLHSRERAAAGPACSMSTVVLASLGAVAVGMGGVLQVGVNSVLAGLLGHQLPAAFVSFAGGSADASNLLLRLFGGDILTASVWFQPWGSRLSTAAPTAGCDGVALPARAVPHPLLNPSLTARGCGRTS